MATATAVGSNTENRQWFIVSRYRELEGESRANWVRLIAIGLFYLIATINVRLLSTPDDGLLAFHQNVSWLVLGWAGVALAVIVAIRGQYFPLWLKYGTTGCDLLLLTALASLKHGSTNSHDGPFSPLVLVYGLIIALAAMRFSLGLVWFATLGSLLGFLLLVGVRDAETSKWFDEVHVVPPVVTLTSLAAIAMTGVVMGQVVRSVRGMAVDYRERMARQ